MEGSRLNTPAAAGSREKNFANPNPDGPFKLLEYQQARGMSVVGKSVCLLVQVSWSLGALGWWAAGGAFSVQPRGEKSPGCSTAVGTRSRGDLAAVLVTSLHHCSRDLVLC